MLRAIHERLDRYEPASLNRASFFLSIAATFIAVLALLT